MSIAHLLEDFTIQVGVGAVHLLDDEALEEQRLAAFEKGYDAGWEDASNSRDQGHERLSTDLAASLSDLSFTYHEALTRMTASLEPMFQSLIETVLPKTLDRGFVLRLADELSEMARDQMAQPLQLAVSAEDVEQVKALLPSETPLAVEVIEEPSLQTGQARMRLGMAQREVDCAALLTAIEDVFDAYVFEAKEALSNE